MKTIAFQTEFRPALPVVFGAKDYREFRETRSPPKIVGSASKTPQILQSISGR